MTEKKKWLTETHLKSASGKWEIERWQGKNTVILTYNHDSQRMMRNTIGMTYAEFEQLTAFLKQIS